MLQTGLLSKTLCCIGIEGNDALDLGAKLRVWLHDGNDIIRDIQILSTKDKISAIVIYEGSVR